MDDFGALLKFLPLIATPFKYSQDVKNAQNASLRDAVAIRGGQWSNVQPQGYEQPNLWGDIAAAGATTLKAGQNEQAANSNMALARAIAEARSGGGGLNFDVPSADSLQMGGGGYGARRYHL